MARSPHDAAAAQENIQEEQQSGPAVPLQVPTLAPIPSKEPEEQKTRKQKKDNPLLNSARAFGATPMNLTNVRSARRDYQPAMTPPGQNLTQE